MKQFTQKLKNGEMKVFDVPFPSLSRGHVLVRNYYSLISAGTEGSRAQAARKGYIAKAKERPQQFKQVVASVKNQGLVKTYQTVMQKLDVFGPVGSSSVGEVIAVGAGVEHIKVGDFVACAGAGACHAEIVDVATNLCVKVDPNTNLKSAAYNTLGAIALQGVRQADMRLGETCAIIGLGLLGQLTALMLRASGVRVVGIDVSDDKVAMAVKNCVDVGFNRATPGLESRIMEFCDGHGCDAVIITAGSSSLDPINFAGAISRKKGVVVVVGATPTGFDREPHYYNKELTVKMSCSYGPGRYDARYEQSGIDYPFPYVRWTENRNMMAFQELIRSGKINLDYLTTHIYKLEDASKAYDMIVEKKEPYVGILIEYDVKEPLQERIFSPAPGKERGGAVKVGFIGAGSYAQKGLLPFVPKEALRGVMTSSPLSSRSVADKYGFDFCTCTESEILHNEEINTVFIATRHDTHASYVKKALNAGKNVFVEKPLCLTVADLIEIQAIYSSLRQQSSAPHLMVGFNRRFSPVIRDIKDVVKGGPLAMVYRINAGRIPSDSWVQDPEVGGGRILGEVCHFIDLLTFINGSLPESLHAYTMDSAESLHDTVNISIKFRNGSIGTISYFANGCSLVSKEYLEVYSYGTTAIVDDFKVLTVDGKKVTKLSTQDKGQKDQITSFLSSLSNGGDAVIPVDEIFASTLATLKVLESLKTGQQVPVSLCP